MTSHKYEITLAQLELMIEALVYASQDAIGDSEQREFKELRGKLIKVRKNWPQDGDDFKEYMVTIRGGDKTWDDFSPAFREAFELADKAYLDRVCESADQIEEYDHEEARNHIVDALKSRSNYGILAAAVEYETDTFYDKE